MRAVVRVPVEERARGVGVASVSALHPRVVPAERPHAANVLIAPLDARLKLVRVTRVSVIISLFTFLNISSGSRATVHACELMGN